MTQQSLPCDECQYCDDPNIQWGFWSWDPRYDHTMSSDQSTHHVRGYWFFLDYFLSLPDAVQATVANKIGQPSEPVARLNHPEPATVEAARTDT